MAQFLPSLVPAVDANGDTLTGAVWEFYAKGTTTPQALAGGSTSATSDGTGSFATLTLNDAVSYRAVLKSSSGVVLYDVTSLDEALFDAGVKAALVNGQTVSGATWSFYTTGTTTPLTVYADPDLTVPLGSVVTSNASGVFPEIYLDTSNTYKAVLQIGDTTETIDPVTENNMGLFFDPEFQQALEPSADWDGTVTSGFDGSFGATPTDPTRTTAKPACRLITVPQQYFTDELVVGAIAFANNNGTLIGGVEKLRFHFEGNTIDVATPTIYTFDDVNGTSRSYYGYWVTLKKPTGTSGHANLYVEAFPADATMQNRVIGPYRFSPQSTLHDFSITVNSGGGADYTTVEDALDYLITQSAQNPLVTITGGGPYTANRVGAGYTGGMGWCTITADKPVTFSRPGFIGDVASDFRYKYDGVRFASSFITFDMQHVRHLRPEDTRPAWLDGVNFTSDGRAQFDWRRGRRPIGAIVRGSPYFTECDIEDVNDCCNEALLVRGCSARRLIGDFGGNARCMVYNDIVDLSGKDNWLEDVDALTVQYTGAEATATLEKSGGATALQTFTARWGANSATFRVSETEAFYDFALGGTYDPTTDGQGYFVQDVADWLNSLPGFTATVLDDTRAACWLSIPANRGLAFSAVDVKTAPYTFVRCFDIHGDFFQHRFTGLSENVVLAFNTGIQMAGQMFFVSSQNEDANDFYFVNNAFSNTPSVETYINYTQTASQCDRGPHSNVVFAHNSLPTQRLFLDSTDPNYTNDSYCLIANNAFLNLLYASTPSASQTNVVIKDNVIDGVYSAPTNSTGTVASGDYTDKFTDSITGNFSPAGALLSNVKTSIVDRDLENVTRGATEPAGAVS